MRTRVATGFLLIVSTLPVTGCAEIISRLEALDPAGAATPEDGLREALRVGTDRAVGALGARDGYLENVDVRIPIPWKVDTLARGLRAIGAGEAVDEFVTSMNRAAEAAAPLAKSVFVDTINKMTFTDAVTILRGENHEATDYLQKHAGPQLRELFRPIVEEKLDSVGATRAFGRLTERTEGLPFMQKPVLDLDEYVTDEALKGLFSTIAKEEERIREDPLARTTALLKRFFGDGAK